jgi:hypothetical protein
MLCCAKQGGAGKDETRYAKSEIERVEKPADIPSLLIDYLCAQINQDFRNIDLDRADFVTGSAE